MTDRGEPFVSGLFDAYRSSIVAPDHLLTGLAKNIVTLCFYLLPETELRSQVDLMICSALSENGLVAQSSVYNERERKLHSMSLSGTFCLLLVSVPVFKNVFETCTNEGDLRLLAVQLMETLQKLVGMTYWWPKREVHGVLKLAYFNRNGRESYFRDLQNLSSDYVRNVHNLCKESEQAKSF